MGTRLRFGGIFIQIGYFLSSMQAVVIIRHQFLVMFSRAIQMYTKFANFGVLYISRYSQHFAAKRRNFTSIRMLFSAVVKDFVHIYCLDQNLVYHGNCLLFKSRERSTGRPQFYWVLLHS